MGIRFDWAVPVWRVPKLARIFLASALAGMLSNQAASARPAIRLPFQLLDNRVFIPVSLDGHGPCSFILDTGSSEWGLSQELARRLRLKAETRESISGAGEGKDSAETLHVETVTVGTARFRHQLFYASDFASLSTVIGFRHFDGVAGEQVFAAYAVDVDFGSRHVTLTAPQEFTPPAGAIVVPFEFDKDSMPMVQGSIEGHPGQFVVDLGDRSSLTLYGPFWRVHHLDAVMAPQLKALTGYGVGGPIYGLFVRAGAFTFGDAHVKNIVTRLSLQKSGAFADPKIAGSIGVGVLKNFRVIFDYTRKRMVLVPVRTKGDAFDRSGLWLGPAPGGFRVYDVIADSPAGGAGLQVGDIVTAIDGKPATQIDVFDLRRRLADPEAPSSIALSYCRRAACHVAKLGLRDLLPEKR